MSLKRVVGRARDRLVGNAFERAMRRARNRASPRVLLYWNRGLGDIALGLCALIERIRGEFSAAQISVITRSDLQQAFAMTAVDQVLVWPGLARGDRDGFSRSCAALHVGPSGYDIVLDRPDPTGWLAGGLGRFVPRLRWPAQWNALADRFAAIRTDRPVIVAHVSSETGQFYGYVKDWPGESWRELFARIGDRHAVQWVLVGHAQPQAFDRPDVLDLRGATSLPEVLSILRNRTRILVAVDSGILSLVFYVDQQFPLQVVSLWSDPRQGVLKQAVASPNALLRHCPLVGDDEDVRRLSVDRVTEAVEQALGKIAASPPAERHNLR
jgi:hypothetical protein